MSGYLLATADQIPAIITIPVPRPGRCCVWVKISQQIKAIKLAGFLKTIPLSTIFSNGRHLFFWNMEVEAGVVRVSPEHFQTAQTLLTALVEVDFKIEVINQDELAFQQMVGRYGIVAKAVCRDNPVAVKIVRVAGPVDTMLQVSPPFELVLTV
jgi:hypothetical protein